MRLLQKVLAVILVSAFSLLVVGCGKKEKPAAADLATTTAYWDLKHRAESINEACSAADKIWKERNSFLLRHTGDLTKWDSKDHAVSQEIEARFVSAVSRYNQLAHEYNEEYGSKIRKNDEYKISGIKPTNLPGNLPSSIPLEFDDYEHGEGHAFYYDNRGGDGW